MVALHRTYNFSSIIDEFFALKPLKGPHADALRDIVETRVRDVLNHNDVRYMPAFKLLDLIADMVNHAAALDAEPQLRSTEATALMRNALDNESPRLRRFLLDAALERARYEPMMILGSAVAGDGMRDLTLRKRWQAMHATHQSLNQLPGAWMTIVDAAVDAVIAAPCFANYRAGPLMQCFAEMLELARQLHDKESPPEVLIHALAEGSSLWKRYALKAARYRAKQPMMFAVEQARPTMH